MTSDDAFLAEVTAYLAERGYKVTKSRAPRLTSSAELPADGRKRAKDPSGRNHGHCAEHWRLPGYAKPVCVARPELAEDGAPIGEEWTDRERVLAFAGELAAIAATAGDVLTEARYAAAAHAGGHLAERVPSCASCRRADRSDARAAAVDRIRRLRVRAERRAERIAQLAGRESGSHLQAISLRAQLYAMVAA